MSVGSDEKRPQDSLTPRENAAIIPALFQTEEQEQGSARRVIWYQFLVTLTAAGMAMVWGGSPQNAIAVLGGGGVSILNGAMIAWRMSQATRRPIHDAHQQLRLLYYFAAERFLLVVVLLGLILAALKEFPLQVVCGFLLGQATLILARLLVKINTESGSTNVQ